MLLAKALGINYRIGIFLACLLLIVDIENPSFISRLILELNMLSFELLTTALILSFTIFWMHFTANALNLLSLFNTFETSDKFGNFIKK